jgi:hypothetical protein
LRIKAKVISATNNTNIAEVYAMSQIDIDSTPNNLVESEDDYASVSINVRGGAVASSGDMNKGGERLADTGVATMLAFGLGSGLLIAAIALEEIRGKMMYDEDDGV